VGASGGAWTISILAAEFVPTISLCRKSPGSKLSLSAISAVYWAIVRQIGA
jgi:hypothetical protein